MIQLPAVEIYTDGACSGNPGPGGYGIILKYKDVEKELSGGFLHTTNNRMELMAVIKGLEALKQPCRVTLYSDSQYIINAINKGWINKWRANNWFRSKDKPAKNADLWKKLLSSAEKHKITWIWVKGHSTNTYNNRCDQLAVEASIKHPLPADEGFLK
ncbi:MAG TPA: ribonuclease HI [Desulfotomaculum sp.]|jgi:ribonuclease HI|nr:ribonuclease HI [Desulfotomaculum sp.]